MEPRTETHPFCLSEPSLIRATGLPSNEDPFLLLYFLATSFYLPSVDCVNISIYVFMSILLKFITVGGHLVQEALSGSRLL